MERKLEEVCKSFSLSEEEIERVRDVLNGEIDKGLGKETNGTATVKCFPTYVRRLPCGKEVGKYLALDLGGTNFRVYLFELGGGGRTVSKSFTVSKEVMNGPGVELFDFIAKCLSGFIMENGVEGERLPLGFTFSFPCKQEGLGKGVLTTWTKGFSCSGVVGEDVVGLLQEAIERRGDVDIEVKAVLNDTTGTMVSCAYEREECKIGVIVGTRTNACYMERLDKVGTWDGEEEGPQQVAINTEWGAFGDDGCLDFIRTEFDKEVDHNSIDKGKQLFGKMISGMYLGELAGLVLRRLCRGDLLLGGKGGEKFFEKGSFLTEFISEIEGELQGETKNCRRILEEKLGVQDCTEEDYGIVRRVCEVVSTRAAMLVSAGVACLINRIGERRVVVAMDGSVHKCHPTFHHLMEKGIARLIEPGIEYELVFEEGGSGRGAALVAAVAEQIEVEREEPARAY